MEDITTLTHSKSGAKAKIHAFGATVISFCDASGQERLFLSKKAVLDGSQAIRGGIPIIFPIFGPPVHGTMPKHGFARLNRWKLKSTDDHEEFAVAVFVLEYSKDVQAETCGLDNDWNKSEAKKDGTDCRLTYEVRIKGDELITTLTLENTGTDSFPFHALLHTYFKVPDVSKVKIHGLGGYAITDKVSGDSGHVQSYDDDVTITNGQEIDSIFIHPDNHPVLHAKLDLNADTIIQIEAAGQVDEQVSPLSCVVWNPGKEKANLVQLDEDEEYNSMLCLEPGLLGHQPLLAPQATARISQTICVVPKTTTSEGGEDNV